MMNDNDIAKSKFAMFMRAYEQARHKEESLDELRAEAFEVLLLHPGCDFSTWAETLTRQNGTELIDAYGTDPAKIYASLQSLWTSLYRDEASGLERDYKTWAEAFSTLAAVDIYYEMIKKT